MQPLLLNFYVNKSFYTVLQRGLALCLRFNIKYNVSKIIFQRPNITQILSFATSSNLNNFDINENLQFLYAQFSKSFHLRGQIFTMQYDILLF